MPPSVEYAHVDRTVSGCFHAAGCTGFSKTAWRIQPEIYPLNKIPGITLLETSNGQIAHLQVAGEIDALIKALARFPVSDFEIKRPSLEELFLVYYQGSEPEEVQHVD